MRRVLAVVAAGAMVAGAVIVRSRLDAGDGDGGKAAGRLTCSSELQAVCESLQGENGDELIVVVEPAGVTAERLAATTSDPGLDGWLVAAPWPEIVDGRRRARALAPLFPSAGEAVARSPLVLVAWKDRLAVLTPRCEGGALDWRCLGEAAGVPGGWAAIGGQPGWGPVKPGHAQPSTDDVGLLVLGQAAADYFGRSDLSTVDLDDDGFRRWFGGLERAVPQATGSPLGLMLAAGPSAYDAVGTTEAEAGAAVGRSARRSSLELLYPAPMATADLVLATLGSESGARLRRSLGDSARQALAEAGWRVEGRAPKGGGAAVALPPESGLPAPGLLDALRGRWEEETGR